MRILIVDDEHVVRNSMSRMIRTYSDKYDVEVAEDGEEAIAILQQQPADLVISDIRMPVIDGIQLSSYIRQHYPDTHTILLTGYADFDYALHALRTDVFDYLLKPASKERIIECIQKVEQMLEHRENNEKLALKRNRDMLDKLIMDLLYGLPISNCDEDLFPPYDDVILFSLTASRDILWERPIRFFIKNVLLELLEPVSTPVIAIEEGLITIVLFVRGKDPKTLRQECVRSKETIEQLLKIELRMGYGGESKSISDINILYIHSLKELGLLNCSTNMSEQMNRLVRLTLDYIEAEYASDLTLASVADKLEVNPNYLSGLLRSKTGFTFTHHLIQYRLEKAKELLATTNLKIYQICEQVGYVDQAYFSRLFKATFGKTPNQYREQGSVK
ncbi:response regulator [Paenibacillus alkaliterrae]|uniref:response regulator transcription factor n=1 Tax=Paenibacillus alkaliterrae TaxID=320909 RepID=UPI002286235E|nr:response regulator [Paenibacillus alkaliterrae]MCF2937385.1 response regulator [Paenibacillus alkaliterrae]